MIALGPLFQEINLQHFDGCLDPPQMVWNSRLRSSAGRFIPGSLRFFRAKPPVIEIASYLREEGEAAALIRDTLAHEMIHYWLWVRRQPYGHTDAFYRKMREMGVSRYNPVPRLPAPKYLYRCPVCLKDFPARRKLGVLACLECCRNQANGKFDHRFKLELIQQLR
ncbi:MAG: SprT-like domain-containing protein [Cryobacterium sp.]|nr:SprT-like domain-containing protein [Oligoflexia bacterium]